MTLCKGHFEKTLGIEEDDVCILQASSFLNFIHFDNITSSIAPEDFKTISNF